MIVYLGKENKVLVLATEYLRYRMRHRTESHSGAKVIKVSYDNEGPYGYDFRFDFMIKGRFDFTIFILEIIKMRGHLKLYESLKGEVPK